MLGCALLTADLPHPLPLGGVLPGGSLQLAVKTPEFSLPLRPGALRSQQQWVVWLASHPRETAASRPTLVFKTAGFLVPRWSM